MPNIDPLNAFPPDVAYAALLRCCGSTRWAGEMNTGRPYASSDELFETCSRIESNMSKADWLEAFAAHPRIGDKEALRKKFASTATWCEGEQADVDTATKDVLNKLAVGNAAYEERFGYIFIVCATGKSSAEMLAILDCRLPNDPEAELRIAAGEQAKITRLRLEKL